MYPAILKIPEICYRHGVRYAVFSPGSRNAPLSISFSKYQKIETYVIVDERSAGFIALGIAQATKSPVVLCCTSGTALLNYGPAIAEAFYLGIPLIVLSADRPPEWIDQWDGQTIRQQNVFSNHTLSFVNMPVEIGNPDSFHFLTQKLSTLIEISLSGNQGPVHANFPFREPLYPSKTDTLEMEEMSPMDLRTTDRSNEAVSVMLQEINRYRKVLIVLGQGLRSEEETKLLSKISSRLKIPVVADVISNGHGVKDVIQHQDLFLRPDGAQKDLVPELIISFGKSVISKNLKLFFRNSGIEQWHVSEYTDYQNPFSSRISFIKNRPVDFLEALLNSSGSFDHTYYQSWQSSNKSARTILGSLSDVDYSEFYCFGMIMSVMPDEMDIHLANSMSVRYANFIGLKAMSSTVYANRGTSGIDGTNGTAVGHALVSQRKTLLLTGDLSFLYDRNAFFHEYDVSNLSVIVLNNFGGGIFNMISGPASLEDSQREKFFITPHSRDMKLAAQEIGASYYKANDAVTLDLALTGFFERTGKPKLLEIQTDHKINQKVFKQIKTLIHK